MSTSKITLKIVKSFQLFDCNFKNNGRLEILTSLITNFLKKCVNTNIKSI